MKKIKTIKEFLKSYYDKNEDTLKKDYPGLPFKRFLEEYCEFDNSTPEDDFFMENPAFFEKIKLGVPLEYINFKSFFYSNEFYVNQSVLIPRNETEILVENAINIISKNYHEDFSVYDVGAGSGAIALTIATEVKDKLLIIASDLSDEAIDVAKINYDNLANKINNETVIEFKIQDRLKGETRQFDLILSNPPYIKEEADEDGVHRNVHQYEPHLALYLKDDLYDQWFETLISQTASRLKSGGCFLMEGHEDNLADLKILAQKYFYRIEIKKDFTQRDRFLHCFKA